MSTTSTHNGSIVPPFAPAGPATFDGIEVDFIGSRYGQVTEVNRGGCGQVLRAFDRELQRHVAIKQILPEIRNARDAEARFLNEARITARLSHPGIVPIHDLGYGSSSGAPFYAMKWLQGTTLIECIQTHHAISNRVKKQRSLRQLLTRFLSVCQTVAYAHSQGIVHRDLKPSNVFIGEFGETSVLDWGIAKDLNLPPNSSLESSVDFGLPTLPTDEHLTRMGTILGTDAYMSPEQANGDSRLVDRRSDVFSLGAILYEILSGCSPFQCETSFETIQHVKRAECVHVRKLAPSIPRALAAICHKAISKKPEDRYCEAGALASDIEAYLANDPVQAHPERWWFRVDRIATKHRTLAWSVVLSLFVISTVSIIAAATIHQARTQERAALAIAKKEQAEKTIALESEKLAHQAAVTQLQSARESIDDWILGLDADLGLYPGLSPLRMHLQDKADAHYRVLSRQSTTTPLMSLEVARAKIRLAEIEYAKQNAKESESLFQSAITQLEHEPFPFDTDWHDIATIQMALAKVGVVKVRVNSSPEADNELDIIDSACSELESISDRSPVSAEARTALAKAMQVKAAALFAFGDPTGAQSEAERALVVADKLETRDKQACSHRLLLSLLEDLARYRLAQNHYADALSAYRQTIAVYDAMLSGGRLRPDWLESRANAKVQAALCHSQMIQPNEAVTNLESAETDLKHAWEIFGGVSVFHDKVSQVYKSLGYSFLLVGDSEQAERVLSQSIDSMQRSLRDSIPTMHSALQFAQSYLWMAIAIESNSSTDFSKQLDLAAKEIAKLVEWKCQDPSIPFMQMQHAWLLGRHQCREGALDDAEATLQRALANEMTTDPNNDPPDQLLVRGRILRVLARTAKRRSNEQTMNEKLAEARHYWQIAQQAGGRVGATAAFERLESMCEDSSLMESESIQAWTLAKELTTKYETSPRAWFLMAEAAFLRNELEVARTALSKVERLRRSTPEDRLLKELIEQKNASDSTIGVEARHAGISERNAVTCLPDTHAEFLLHLLDDKSRPTR